MQKTIISFFLFVSICLAREFYPEVKYRIDAELIPATKSLLVKSLMFYKNNSPDTLNEIYVHIYWNLYSEHSYARKLALKQKDYYSQKTGDVELHNVVLKQNQKTQQNVYELDNTVMKIPLLEPLKPGQSIELEIELSQEVPPEGLRMGYNERNFSIAHWFPSICVYDQYGWHKDQYLGTGEFYEEISDFEVNLTLPATYFVFYSGELINPDEVYDETVLKRLELAKKSETPIRIFEPQSKIQPNDEVKKTWKFKAQNVRTFAFACFEDYLWDASAVGNVLVHTVYPKNLEVFYKEEGMKAAQHAIKFFSEKIGPYIYPQMFVTVGGSTGGMEYPGIVFMGRGLGGGIMAKNTASVIIHEIGHNWFPMMLNSNEIEYPFMDEGFNTFFTNLAMEELYGRDSKKLNLSGILGKLIEDSNFRTTDHSEIVIYQKSGYTEPIITHSDRYEQIFAYVINSYPKTSVVLFMLQYVMGDEAFDELWKEYYKQFLLKKIYPEDFFNLAEKIYQRYHGRKSVRWFFDEWFYKDYSLDFVLKKFDVEKSDTLYQTTVTICNTERAIMPCDIEITFEDGERTTVYFDYDDFSKGVQIASKTFHFEKKPVRAEINPDKRLLDINRLNNSSDFPAPVSFKYKPILNLSPDPFNYSIYYSPHLWFNNYDGFQMGLNLQGRFLDNEKTFSLNFYKGLKRGIHSVGGYIEVGDRLNFLGPLAHGSLKFFNLEGRRGLQFKIKKTFAKYHDRNPKIKVEFSANYFDAYDDTYFNRLRFDSLETYISGYYPYVKEILNRKYLFAALNIEYKNNWQYFETKFTMNYESGVLDQLKKQNQFYYYEAKEKVLYQKLSLSFIQEIKSSSFLPTLSFRQFVGVTPKKLPKAKEFYLATVNPIDEFNLPLYRTYGFMSRNFITNHSIPNGDGFMIGYYKNNISDDLITTFNGKINFVNTLTKLGKVGNFVSILNPEFFFDYGNVWANEKEINWNAFKYDWGISFSLIPKFDDRISSQLERVLLFDIHGISDLRFDFPLFVSHPPSGEKKFQFRWLISFIKLF